MLKILHFVQDDSLGGQDDSLGQGHAPGVQDDGPGVQDDGPGAIRHKISPTSHAEPSQKHKYHI